MSDIKPFISEAVVKRIAVFNPYLQGGHTKTAEMESPARFVACAVHRGIQVKMFDNSHDIMLFKPDFVFSITYQTGKLTPFPTYMNVNIPVTMIHDVHRFVRNILSCDGFVTVSESVKSWLMKICQQYNKTYICCDGYFSVEKTEFKPANYEHAVCAYMGTNWDGTRHSSIFNRLSDGKYLKCYGPRESWKLYPDSLFGGEVPFDGVSTLKMYNNSGMGLCIGHPQFDEEGIANNRMYEIVAAGAMPIASNNSLTKEFYGDTILYFNHLAAPNEVADQIIHAVQWVRSNPKLTESMTAAAHDLFNKNLSMEYYLDQMLAMHQKYLSKIQQQKMAITNKLANSEMSLCYIIANPVLDSSAADTIASIVAQGVDNPNVFLISKNEPRGLIEHIKNFYPKVHVSWISYQDERTNDGLINALNQQHCDLLVILNPGDILFDHYTACLTNFVSVSESEFTNYSEFVMGSLSHSRFDDSLEQCDDPHIIKYHDFSKIQSFLTGEQFPISSIIFSSNLFSAIIKDKTLYHLNEFTIQTLSTLGVNPIIIPNIALSVLIDRYYASKNLYYVSQVKKLETDLILREISMNEILNSRSWRYFSRARKVVGRLKRVSMRVISSIV